MPSYRPLPSSRVFLTGSPQAYTHNPIAGPNPGSNVPAPTPAQIPRVNLGGSFLRVFTQAFKKY